jgi:hypothetical protein
VAQLLWHWAHLPGPAGVGTSPMAVAADTPITDDEPPAVDD